MPDTYGVYKFVVSYHRPGYTALDVVKRVKSPMCFLPAEASASGFLIVSCRILSMHNVCGQCQRYMALHCGSGMQLLREYMCAGVSAAI